MSITHRPWIFRAVLAGLIAALVGIAIGAMHYRSLPGATRLDWSVMIWVLLGYAALCGVLGGLGLGGAMTLATRGLRDPARVSSWRLVLGAVVGGALGCLVPAVWGIAGFGSLHAPYAGTANIVFSILAGSTVFVALWAPTLSRDARESRTVLRTVGISVVSAVVSCGSLGVTGWSLATMLGAIPSFEALASVVALWGLLPFALVAGLAVGMAVGAIMGLATWIYLRLERASSSAARI